MPRENLPFQNPDDLDFTPPPSDFLEKATPVEPRTAEQVLADWESHRDNIKMSKKLSTPEGKPNLQRIIEEHPTEIPESFTPRDGRPLTRVEMDKLDKIKSEKDSDKLPN